MNSAITSLLASYKETSTRTRSIFSILNIASIILLISFFNYRLSWKNNENGISAKRINVYELQERHFDKAMLLCDFLTSRRIGYDTCKLVYAINKFYGFQFRDTCEESCTYRGIEPVNINTSASDDFSFLTIPIIGIKIYVQDIPLLGGFAVAILLTWYYYARRREKSIAKIIANKLDDENEKIEDETKEQASIGISFATIFSSIKNVDDGNETLFKNKKFSENILRYLFYAPTILLLVILAWDTFESYFYGPSSQKYLILDETKEEPIYLKSSGIDYFLTNFAVNEDELREKAKKEYNEHCTSFLYTDIVFEGKQNRLYRIIIKIQMIFMTILSSLVLWYCWILSSKVRKFRDDEKIDLEKIYNHLNLSETRNIQPTTSNPPTGDV